MSKDTHKPTRPAHSWSKYLLVFVITAGIFAIAFYVSNVLTENKMEQLQTMQNQIATNILSSETRFALLERTSCKHLVNEPILSEELRLFGSRLTSMEEQLGSEDPKVRQLKRYYSLLQIKDYLLVTKLSEKCNTKPVTILYFYNDSCNNCKRQGYVLTELQKKYEDIRVYSFDYNLKLSALKTLISIHNVPSDDMPALVINDELYTGFTGKAKLEDVFTRMLPQSATVSTNSTATASNVSTKSRVTN